MLAVIGIFYLRKEVDFTLSVLVHSFFGGTKRNGFQKGKVTDNPLSCDDFESVVYSLEPKDTTATHCSRGNYVIGRPEEGKGLANIKYEFNFVIINGGDQQRIDQIASSLERFLIGAEEELLLPYHSLPYPNHF